MSDEKRCALCEADVKEVLLTFDWSGYRLDMVAETIEDGATQWADDLAAQLAGVL